MASVSDTHGSGASVGGDEERIGGGCNAAGSTDNSFEYIPPPGFTVTEEQRAEFDRARQTQTSLSPSPSQRGDDDASEGTMAMLKLMQRQMQMQMLMMMRKGGRRRKNLRKK